MDQGAVFLQEHISVKKRHFYRSVFLRHIYIYSLKESEDRQLLTTKKLKNLIKNKQLLTTKKLKNLIKN